LQKDVNSIYNIFKIGHAFTFLSLAQHSRGMVAKWAAIMHLFAL
jgi:hypothetical protein